MRPKEDFQRDEKSPPSKGLGFMCWELTQKRKQIVAECLALGPPHFVMEKPPNYRNAQPRCTNCRRLKRQHHV